MQVILTKDVDSLGNSGEVFNVSDGYARNFLFPKKLAIQATEGAMKDLNGKIERLRAKADKRHQEDLARAEKVTGLGTLVLEANAGEEGKLFGTITTKELARVLEEKTGQVFERKALNVNQPINRVGEYKLFVKLSAKVSAEVGIQVVAAATDQ